VTVPARQMEKRHLGYALFAASLTAWITYFGMALFLEAVLNTISAISGEDGQKGSSVLVLAAIFGVPVVLVVCFVAGLPALVLAELLKLTKWWQAALVGMGVGLLFGLGVSAMSRAPVSAPIDFARILGFAMFVAMFVLTGACAGVAAWASLWLDRRHAGKRRKVEAE